MHNNLLNEIEGTYTKLDWWLDTIVVSVIAVSLVILAFNWLGGADALLAYLAM